MRLRTKASVAHAGLLLQLQLLKVLTLTPVVEHSFHFQNNNLLTVIRHATAVMEVSHLELLNTCLPTCKFLKMIIPTKLRLV